jgi:hypothetical protein
MECFVGNIVANIVFIILLGISELMARSKKIKENSIHQWITNKLRLIVRGG